MFFEGVTFISKVCLKMSKDEFVEKHIDSLWQNRARKERKKMLRDAYDIMSRETDK